MHPDNKSLLTQVIQYGKNTVIFMITFFRLIYLFLPSISFLLVYYLLIVKLSQGQDMLMQAVEYNWPFFFTILSLLFWMLFAWHSSRLLSDLYIKINGATTPKAFYHAPRLIGYNVAVGLQLAALNLPTIVFPGKSDLILWGLFLWHNGFYFLLHRAFFSRQKKYILLCTISSIIYIYILFNIYWKSKDVVKTLSGIINYTASEEGQTLNVKEHILWWLCLSIFFYIIQILFVGLVVWRRTRISRGNYNFPRFHNIYKILVVIALILYCFIWFNPVFANNYGSLGCLLLAMGLWVGIVCFIKYKSLQYNVRFTILILVWAVVIGYFCDPYDVDLKDSTTPNLYDQRKDIDSYINLWLQQDARASAIKISDASHPYPVYLVIADGGASKSGYWVASVLSKLEYADAKDKFSNHLLSLAGASGGSVGNAAYYTVLTEEMKNKHAMPHNNINNIYEASRFMETDFLTFSIARFLGPDLLRHLVPFKGVRFLDDRAAALEIAMEASDYSPTIGNYFSRTVDKVFDYTGKLPLIFINTTNLQTGSPGVISNVKIDNKFTNRMDVLCEVDAIHESNKYKNIKLSTAVVLGARFPYVSPAGEINHKYFVDGGYYDNSGGGITLELLQHIEKRMKDTTDVLYPLRDLLKFKVLYLSNGSLEEDKPSKLHPLVNDLAAPLLTVLGTYGKQTDMSNNKLENHIMESSIGLKPNPFQKINLPINPKDTIIDYPMNWVISDYNIIRMKDNLKAITPDSIAKIRGKEVYKKKRHQIKKVNYESR